MSSSNLVPDSNPLASSGFEPLSNEAASSMDDIFGVHKNDLETIQNEFSGPEPKLIEPVKVEESPIKSSFKPKLTKAQQEKLQHENTESKKTKENNTTLRGEKKENIEIPEDKVTPELAAYIQSELKKLVQGQNGVRVGNKPEQPVELDWTKISENDVFDLNVPIEAIDHGVPDYLNVELNDKNYVARWVHKTPRRLGPMMAIGWTYVEKIDLDINCHLEVTIDENGHFRYDDVILMKLPKQKYFGQLRRNYERTVAQVSSAKLKTSVQKALLNSPAGGSNKKSAADYMAQNQLKVYVPGQDD
jgi:hypothetical protein